MSKELTPKQQLFISEYLKDFNATQAAIRSGYKEDNAYATGAENLRKPKIRQAIQSYIDDCLGQNKMTLALEIVNELRPIAFDGQGLEIKTNKDGEIYEVSRRDQLKALEMLGKYVTMFVEKKEIDVDIKTQVVITSQDVGLL